MTIEILYGLLKKGKEGRDWRIQKQGQMQSAILVKL